MMRKRLLLRMSALCLMLMAVITGQAETTGNDLTWDYTEKNIPKTSPDNGLYYGGYVNDAAGTNNGMHGVKLNGSGYAFFAKAAVAGKLTLTIGLRSGAGAYAVNVYACTIADGKATKGDLIGEVAVSESPGTGSIDIAADVTGIYIERKTTSEGVLSKIVFKENVARSFVDFEIPYATLTADSYTGADLPTGVTFSGSFHDGQHGYSNATMVVPVDGTVKFTISGCQFGGSFPVKNSEGATLTTLDQKAAGCYDAGGKVTYIYVGEATTLTFGPIQYLSYFKAEATEVQEAVITYKDQNGNKLGEKTVLEGDPLGEVPYTEADLTIPEGYKFRGWVYTNGVKVKASDIVNGDVSVNASVTAIEAAPTVGSIQTYDLTKATFYPEDHENFDVNGGVWHDGQHGFVFQNGNSFSIKVSGKAQVVVTRCQYSASANVTVTDANNNPVGEGFNAKVEACGSTAVVNYDGAPTTLTFTFAGTAYIHDVKVYNVKDFLEKDVTSGWYIVPAGDAASLVLALSSAGSEANSRVFLPNGTYDLGETVLTGISGTNVSIIGQSMEGVIIKNAPPKSMEGLKSAATLLNTSTALYMQDLTLQNALDYYGAGGTARANAFQDMGNKTVCKNVKLLSYQDTYLSGQNKQYYWETSEIHGTVDYICGGSDVFFESCTLVNESRAKTGKDGEVTITAHQPGTTEAFGYVFNNCTINNNAKTFNLGRAWGQTTENLKKTPETKRPTVTFLNTKLNQPSEIVPARFTLKGMNNQSGVFHEYNSVDADNTVVSPASLSETFTDKNGDDASTYDIILSADAAAGYALNKVFTSWTPDVTAKQVDAPTDAAYNNGTITWTAKEGATAYALFKNNELIGITTATTFNTTVDPETECVIIRAANTRGGFGPYAVVAGTATGINNTVAELNNEVKIYDLQGRRVQNATKGIYVINGKKIFVR